MSGLSGENDSVVVLDLLGSDPLRFFLIFALLFSD